MNESTQVTASTRVRAVIAAVSSSADRIPCAGYSVVVLTPISLRRSQGSTVAG